MSQKTYVPEGQSAPESQIGATMQALAATIASRRDSNDSSYTYRLLNGNVDDVLKKVMEEAGEVALAAKDGEPDHLRYEAADVVYHLLVVLERFNVPLEEFAAELNARMREDERPQGAVLLQDEYIKRGK